MGVCAGAAVGFGWGSVEGKQLAQAIIAGIGARRMSNTRQDLSGPRT